MRRYKEIRGRDEAGSVCKKSRRHKRTLEDSYTFTVYSYRIGGREQNLLERRFGDMRALTHTRTHARTHTCIFLLS